MSGLNSVDDIPKAWTYALRSVRNHFPEAILAGGALRDRHFGAKVKDLDIFVHGTKDEAQNAAKMLEREGWHGVSFGFEETYAQGVSEAGITGIVDAEFPGAPPVQIIFMDRHVDQLLPLFDFGINQITYDGRIIHRSANFAADAVQRRFRIISEVSDSQFVRIINRWARLKEKYPTWQLDLGTRGSSPTPVTVTLNQVVKHQGKTLLHQLATAQLGQPYLPKVEMVVPMWVSRALSGRTGIVDYRVDHHSQTVMLKVDADKVSEVTRVLGEFLTRLGGRIPQVFDRGIPPDPQSILFAGRPGWRQDPLS